MKAEEQLKQKVLALAILIAGKVVDKKVLDKIYDSGAKSLVRKQII